MTCVALDQAFAGLLPVSIAELDSCAALQTRIERKYVVSPTQLAWAIDRLGLHARALEIDGRRRFAYRSLYFDTPEYVSYLSSTYRRPNRFKVRTRRYLDSGRGTLEVKVKDRRGHTVKHRVDCTAHDGSAAVRQATDPTGLHAREHSFVARFAAVGPHLMQLQPVLTTEYRRSTLLVANRWRATVDHNVTAATDDQHRVALQDSLVVETKSDGPPSPLDRILWKAGSRPLALSKYCTSLAALNPSLPANRWYLTLKRHAWIRS